MILNALRCVLVTSGGQTSKLYWSSVNPLKSCWGTIRVCGAKSRVGGAGTAPTVQATLPLLKLFFIFVVLINALLCKKEKDLRVTASMNIQRYWGAN